MKIGIFAPSAACSPEQFNKAKAQALGFGYDIVEPHSSSANFASKKFLFSSDSIENRIEAFRKLLSEPQISLILATRGGYGSLELLPELLTLKENLTIKTPIYLSGLSDASNLLLALDGVPNLHLIHGPGFLSAFCEYNQDLNRKVSTQKLFEIVDASWLGYSDLSLCDISSHNNSSRTIEGKLLGGNLTVLATLIGTPYLPDFSGRILFLEETGEKPYRVHRSLSQLKYSGLFDNIAGVLLGDFNNCVHEKGVGPNLDDVLNDIFLHASYPVFRGFPGGHESLNLPLPFGVRVLVSKTGVVPLGRTRE